MSAKLFCYVRICDIAYSADKNYTYSVPPDLRVSLRKGSLVLVPFGHGNRLRNGIVVGFSDFCEYERIKPVSSVSEDYGLVSEETAALCLFIADRCFCTVGAALKAILPPGMNATVDYLYSAASETEEGLNPKALVIYRALKEKSLTENELVSAFGDESKALLSALYKDGIITRTPLSTDSINEKNLQFVRLTAELETAYSQAKTEKQTALIDALSLEGEISVSEALRFFGISRSVINTLCKKNICEIYEKRIERTPFEISEKQDISFSLSDEQKQAVSKTEELLCSGEAKGALLHGVTGSGKTRAIIETVKKTLALGKSAIVLIPEIGLTSEAISIYAAEFGESLAVTHSMLSIGERIDTARALASGEKKVVIGTRSAVFAPVQNLGLIVIDEEQEHTYKSENTPKFHARDVARFRCAYNKALMLLSSATPSVESYYKATQGVYTLISLTKRYGGASLPNVVISDIKRDSAFNSGKLLGKELGKKLTDTVCDGKQAILFVGRRGYSSFVNCASCGQVISCPNCSVSLTYHAVSGENRRNERLHCHYCGYSIPLPKECPSCGAASITRFGFGTQKLQEELEKYYPDIRAIRMDTDTTGTRHSHGKRFNAFRQREADLLFGTQMIAKGLDFPAVSLVGVISVDEMLYQNDFRASERTFSLLTQLAGRAGRAGEKGEAVMQTANPDSDILQLVKTGDYRRFFEGEISIRRAVTFPPFCDLALFRFSADNEADAKTAANSFAVILTRLLADEYPEIKTVRFGPFSEGIYKINNKFRIRLVVKYKDCSAARNCFRKAFVIFDASNKTAATAEIDINPTVI